jgi:hypothetical protein
LLRRKALFTAALRPAREQNVRKHRLFGHFRMLLLPQKNRLVHASGGVKPMAGLVAQGVDS